ncbi:MAG TPA: TldD/PmbA family protein [bacterium]|nr:TldD/PmbA family protein [bacterium]
MELGNAIGSAVRKLENQKLEFFEVAGISDVRFVAEAKGQMVEGISRSKGRGVALRVVRDGRVGFSATTDIGPKAIEKAVQQAVMSMKEVAPSDEASLPPAQEPQSALAERLGRTFAEIPDDEKIRMAMLLESAAIAADSRIVKVQHPRYEEVVRSMTVISSTGVNSTGCRGLCLCEIKAVASDGEDSQGAFEFSFSPRFEELSVEETARLAARRAVEKLGAGRVAGGSMPVVMGPRAGASMVKLASSAFFADNVQRGKSVVSSRRGERVYHPDVSIVDDGLLPGGFGSFPFDGEGIPRRRTMLVRNGVIENWLYDGARAAKDGVASTGNCRREEVNRLPSIGVGNCFLKGGESSPEELLREAGRGILITDLIGLHTANTVTGDFSLGAEGFVFDKGVLGAPVRGITVAGNVHELFARVAGVGEDLKFFADYGSPSVLIEELTIGS